MIRLRQILFPAIIALCALILVSGRGVASRAITVLVGEVVLPESISPVPSPEGLIVPIEFVSAFGGSVALRDDEYLVQAGHREAQIRIGEATAQTTRGLRTLSPKPTYVDGHFFVPLRFLVDLLDLRVRFDPQRQILEVSNWRTLRNGVYQAYTSATPTQVHASSNGIAHSQAPLDHQNSSFVIAGFTGEGRGNSAAFDSSSIEAASGNRPSVRATLISREGFEGSAFDETDARGQLDSGSDEPARASAALSSPATSSRSATNATATLRVPTPAPEGVSQPSSDRSNQSTPAMEAPLFPSLDRRMQGVGELSDRRWQALFTRTGLSVSRSHVRGLSRFTFEAEQTLSVETSMLVDPYRLVVDIVGVSEDTVDPWLIGGDGPVERIRTAAVDGGLRLVFDLAYPVGHRLIEEDDGRWIVEFLRPLEEIRLTGNQGGGRMVIGVGGDTPYHITRLVDPERIVIDLEDTFLTTGALELTSDEGYVSRVRAAQFQPDVARIVMEVDPGANVEVVAGDSDLLVFYGDQVGPVAYRIVDEQETHIAFLSVGQIEPRIFTLTHPDRLVIDLPGEELPNPLEDAFLLDGPVVRVRSSQGPDGVRIVADLRHAVQYGVIEEDGRTVVVLRRPDLTGRTVTVDAGHGGFDPGAIGTSGLYEKDVVLDISLRLRELLVASGARVHMTRDDDQFISLWDRSDSANMMGSDAFVSIHANAAASQSESARGTETYYRPEDAESRRLAQAVHRSVLSKLDTNDRGIRSQPVWFVVRETEMPAILAEIGFLSYPEEERLLAEPYYRQWAAEGLYNGLVAFFHPDLSLDEDQLIQNLRDERPEWQLLVPVIAEEAKTDGRN